MSSGPDLADNADWAELARYVSGQASTEEAARIREWAAADPAHRLVLDQATAAWAHARRPSVSPRTDAVWSALAAHLDIAAPGVPVVRPQPWPQGVGGGSAWRSAAIAALVVVVGGGIAVGTVRRGGGLNPAGREYATAAGQRLSVTLVDGTQMTLAPASHAHIPGPCGRGGIYAARLLTARCSGTAREVELEGEAYFAVVHDAAHPFAVRTHGAVVRDVGTAFDVRAYPEDTSARIAVAEGTVAISAPTVAISAPIVGAVRERPAHAGDVATVGPGGVAIEHGADVAALVAWRDGRLVFHDARFSDAARELGRFYDLDVRVSDPTLGADVITDDFTGDPVERVLAILKMSLSAQVERHGRTVVFTRTDRGRR